MDFSEELTETAAGMLGGGQRIIIIAISHGLNNYWDISEVSARTWRSQWTESEWGQKASLVKNAHVDVQHGHHSLEFKLC